MKARVALATYAAAPDLAPDDQLLVPALASLGVESVPAVWSDASIDWARCDGVVIRSCWDYHRRYAEFMAFTQGANPNEAVQYVHFKGPHRRFDMLRAAFVIEAGQGDKCGAAQ